MNFPKVAIIIINWNGWKDTIECLESLYQINYPQYDVILIDNNSEDSSLEKIKKYCEGKIKVESEFFNYNDNNKPISVFELRSSELELTEIQRIDNHVSPNTRLTLIKNDENYGFAEGNNIGIKYVIESLNSDYILLLNNDTVVDKDFLSELLNVAESDDAIGFIGPKVYIYDNQDTLQVAGGSEVDLTHGEVNEIAYHYKDNGKYDYYFEPDFIGGTCILGKRKVIEKIGLLDSEYFMYWEDADWCFRARKNGYKCAYSFKSKIWHKYGASSGTPFKMYYFTRNRIYFMKKNIKSLQFIQFSLFLAAVTLYKSSYQLIRLRDLKMSNAYLKGFINGLKISYNSKNI
ncbi:MAG TPA: glycosyltransferase family 2 protein [Methanobacterium sp.]|nr:glycosyltransferase family 2 protein [Methanobacterium sp.]